MAEATHTRVYGLSDHRPWLRECVIAGISPEILFPVGRKYVVATSGKGELYIRRGPKGPLEIARDPRFFGKRLHKTAADTLRRLMTDTGLPSRLVTWTPKARTWVAEKNHHSVS